MLKADTLRTAARDALATGRWHDGARALSALAALAPLLIVAYVSNPNTAMTKFMPRAAGGLQISNLAVLRSAKFYTQ